MMSKHTPGPWHTGARHDLTLYTEDGMPLGDARHMGNKITVEEMQANAQLMAAAPELLAMCESALEDGEYYRLSETVKRRLRAVIAKAHTTGNSQ